MNKDKIIKDILLEYSALSKTGGIDKLDHDLLVTAIENCGYVSYFSIPKLVNEIESNKTAIGLSDGDIEIINKIIGRGKPEQSRVFFDDDDLRKLDLSNPRNQHWRELFQHRCALHFACRQTECFFWQIYALNLFWADF